MHRTLERVMPHVDGMRPRYLMGVGTPGDLVRAMSVGVDLFDCVLPTRNARNGQAFVRGGRLVMKNARFREDHRPLDETCECPVCAGGFSRAYVRHLTQSREILGHRLLSLHNLHYYASLMASAREAISRGQFAQWVRARLSETGDPLVADGLEEGRSGG